MEPKDVSKEIAEVARTYHFVQQPGFVNDLMEWLAKVLRAIAEFLRELFRSEHSPVNSLGASRALQLAIWAVGLIGVVLLLWSLFQRAKRISAEKKSQTRGADEVQELRDAAGWKRQAASLAAQSDYKGACRAVYLSCLQTLHEAGIAEFAPARTNYEYSYSLARYPSVQQSFRRMADSVESIWFGNREASASDYAEVVRDLQQLDEQMQAARNPADQKAVVE